MPNTLALASLYVLEFSVLLFGIAIYKKSDRPLLDFLPSPAGVVLVFAVLGLVTSALGIIYMLRKTAGPKTTHLYATLVLNLWSVIVVVATAEAIIRAWAVSTPEGPMFASTLLLPRSWATTAARNQSSLAKALVQGSYLIYDNELGWTVGPARRSKDYNRDLVRRVLSQLRYPQSISDYAARLQRAKMDSEDSIYLSSSEGIRSPRVGMSFASVPSRHRIAIVGDSFTFGLEVPYEDTWGHQLELALGQGYQVLNFGVDGYGIDQAYLRYQRDVLSWYPDTVILGLINDDMRRTMCVYGFLCFPGGEIPFPKPRFVMKRQKLSLLNHPLPTPESILEMHSITDLPFIDYDVSFERAEWEQRFYHYAYSVRLLLSRFPRWPVSRSTVSEEAIESVNAELLRSFVRLARGQGSTPIVVYFPSTSDFVSDPTSRPVRTRVAQEVLRATGIPYVDMTDCVTQVPPAQRFVILHYSPAANVAVARCLRDAIRKEALS